MADLIWSLLALWSTTKPKRPRFSPSAVIFSVMIGLMIMFSITLLLVVLIQIFFNCLQRTLHEQQAGRVEDVVSGQLGSCHYFALRKVAGREVNILVVLRKN